MIEPGGQLIRATPGAWLKPMWLAGVLLVGAVVTVLVSDSVKVERWAVVAFGVAVVCALKGAWWRVWPQSASYDVGPGGLTVSSRQLSVTLDWNHIRSVHLQGRAMSWWAATPGRAPSPLRLLVVMADGGGYTLPRILLWGRSEFDEARRAVEEACERESVDVEYVR